MKSLNTHLTGIVLIAIVSMLLAANSKETGKYYPTKIPNHLFPVPIDNRIGFIDSTGHIVINAIYENAQEFSEGYCAVRTNGRYGFINLNGQMVIEPIFDYATSFHEGLALVYVKDKPCFINEEGKFVINPHYKIMTRFYGGKSYVVTNTDNVGVIDKTGKLVIDTIYSHIDRFNAGLTIAYIRQPPTDKNDNKDHKPVIIDSLGNRLTEIGDYSEISGPYEKSFMASMEGKDDHSYSVILNAKGKIVRQLPSYEHFGFDPGIEGGIFLIYRDAVNSDNYDVYTNIQGKYIYGRRQTWAAKNFHENFAFCRNKKRDFILINKEGREIARFDDLHGEGFNNGRALAKKDGVWSIIDTTGTVRVKTPFKALHDVGIVGDYIFFEVKGYDLTADINPTYGFADLQGNPLPSPAFEYFDNRGFIHGLLRTWINNKVTLINTNGKIVWQEKEYGRDQTYDLNIDHMKRCYFSVSHDNTGHASPWGAPPQSINDDDSFPLSKLSVIVTPDDTVHLNKQFTGIKIYVANTTNDTIIFNAQDGVVYMKTQALNEKGQWQDIDFMPRSWCGNSYHSVALTGNRYWQLAMPRYHGCFKTKLRIELSYVNPVDTIDAKRNKLDGRSRDRDAELKTYSNQFEGSINPAQFWRREQYYPNGIMDPYDE